MSSCFISSCNHLQKKPPLDRWALTTLHTLRHHSIYNATYPPTTRLSAVPIATHSNQNQLVPRLSPYPRAYFPNEAPLACQKTGIGKYFGDYFIPTEIPNEQQETCLKTCPPGWLISTGGERAFFSLLLSPEKQTEGLIIRDIHTKMQYFNQGIILLLKLAEDLPHFLKLRAPILPENKEEFKERRITVYRLLQINQTIPEKLKYLYANNLSMILKTYLHRDATMEAWTYFHGFDRVNYLKNTQQFYKLQQYALQGRIIHTVGNMSDLKFLRRHQLPISTIDISNISNFSPLSLPNQARVLWTELKLHETRPLKQLLHSPNLSIEKHTEFANQCYERLSTLYHMTHWEALSPKEKREFNQLQKKLALRISKEDQEEFRKTFQELIPPPHVKGYNQKTLAALRTIFQETLRRS